MTHTYGYARVSTTAQNLDARVDALTGAGGVDERDVVVEKASGRREDRPELARLLTQLREGDTLVVTKLDRSAAHVERLVRDLDDRGVTLMPLPETFGTSSAAGTTREEERQAERGGHLPVVAGHGASESEIPRPLKELLM